MRKINLFYVILVFITVLVIFLANHFIKETDAIVAEVQSQRIAISYQKPVRIKTIHTVPGQHVEKGDLLLEVERPDLLYEIEKLDGEIAMAHIGNSDLIMQYLSDIRVLENEKTQALGKSEMDISELTQQKQNIIQVLMSLKSFSEEEKQSFILKDSSLDIEIEHARNYRKLQLHYYNLKKNELGLAYKSDTSKLNFRIKRLEKELSLLQNEAIELTKYAPCDGTIGNIYWQIEELVQSFETIVSVYESNPTLIKAFMNVENKYELSIGEDVMVMAVDRKYSIPGKIVDIGSRIVGYPARLLPGPNIEMWGQEVFIRIPRENDFLNGEKVFVKL